MKRILNSPLSIMAIPFIIACVFYALSNGYGWKYTVGSIFWIIAIFSVFIAGGIYKLVTRKK